MPTTYAHDVFGKEVYKRLPEKMKNCIKKHRKLYLIGLHGPDILFYYHPFGKNEVISLGGRMHKESARIFFERSIGRYREDPQEDTMAYLLGFGCHFLLDSACHPYIGAFEEKTGISHAEIETHMDRALMGRDGRNPFRYLPASGICTGSNIEQTIAEIIPEVTPEQVRVCLKGMKRFTALPVCRFSFARGILLSALKILGCYDSMEGQIMRKKPNPDCKEATCILLKLYQQALDEAPEMLMNLYQALQGEAELAVRYDRNFES